MPKAEPSAFFKHDLLPDSDAVMPVEEEKLLMWLIIAVLLPLTTSAVIGVIAAGIVGVDRRCSGRQP